MLGSPARSWLSCSCSCPNNQALNAMTVKNKYLLPLISELINKLRGAKYFTKLDVQWGFNNVQMKEGDKWKAVFWTNQGLFEPLVMFFGLCNSPATFQTMMDDIFNNFITEGVVVVYLDNILIFMETLDSYSSATTVTISSLTRTILFLLFTITSWTTCHECMFIYFYFLPCITRMLHASDACLSFLMLCITSILLYQTHAEHALTMCYMHVLPYIYFSQIKRTNFELVQRLLLITSVKTESVEVVTTTNVGPSTFHTTIPSHGLPSPWVTPHAWTTAIAFLLTSWILSDSVR